MIRNTKSRMKLVPQVRGGIPERAICDLETGSSADGWRRVTNADGRVDPEGLTVMRSLR